MIVAELSFVPVGAGTGVSKYVKATLRTLEKTNVSIEPHAMRTVIKAKL